jgi:hypothetical protein
LRQLEPPSQASSANRRDHGQRKRRQRLERFQERGDHLPVDGGEVLADVGARGEVLSLRGENDGAKLTLRGKVRERPA